MGNQEQQIDLIRQLRSTELLSYQEISDKIGLSVDKIRYICKKNSIIITEEQCAFIRNKHNALPIDKTKILEALQSGTLTHKEICQKFNLNLNTLRTWSKKAGILRSVEQEKEMQKRTFDKRNAARNVKIVEAYRSGKSLSEIANISGVKSKSAVSYIVKKAGVYENRAPLVINRDLWNRVIELKKNGVRESDIANQVGLKQSSVHYICGKEGLVLTKEQRLQNANRKIKLEELERAIDERLKNHTPISVIAEDLAISHKTLKWIFSQKGIVIPLEKREENAQKALNDKYNGEHMFNMRKFITPEVHESISVALSKFYKEHPEVREKLSKDSLGVPKPTLVKYSKEMLKDKFNELNFKMSDEQWALIVSWPPKDAGNSNNTWEVKCHCGNGPWYPDFYGILRGVVKSCGCIASHLEKDVLSFVQQFYPKAHKQWFTVEIDGIERKREIDVYVEMEDGRKIGFEINGLKWHGEGIKGSNARSYHLEKTKAFAKLGIRIIHLQEDELVFKKVRVEGLIKSILGKCEHKVNARECRVVHLNPSESFDFLEQNHIQGGMYGNSFGLIYNNEIVSVMTLRKEFKKYGEGVWDLNRFCNKIGYNNRGAFSKLLKHFINEYHPKEIFSFSDNRWSIGNVYKTNGFDRIEEPAIPSYSYFKADSQGPTIHKTNFRKGNIEKMLGLPSGALESVTEPDIMRKMGYDRIWDCGVTKWLLKVTP